MRFLIIFISFMLFGITFLFSSELFDKTMIDFKTNNIKLNDGFDSIIKGNRIVYHSFVNNIKKALIVRANKNEKEISWYSGKPIYEKDGFYYFIFISGIGVNLGNGKFYFYANDSLLLTFEIRKDAHWVVQGKNGSSFEFFREFIDDYGDYFGYSIVKIHKSYIKDNKQVNFLIRGEDKNSNVWFMVFQNKLSSFFNVESHQLLSKDKKQIINIGFFDFLNNPYRIYLNGALLKEDIADIGYNNFELPIDRVQHDVYYEIDITFEDGKKLNKRILVKPVKEWEVHILSHSHNDIGYTDLQHNVAKKQVNNLRHSLKLIEKTANYPYEARFKWNTEIAWPIDEFFIQANDKEKLELIEQIKKGNIDVNGLYLNFLTGILKSEEMFHAFDMIKFLYNKYGITVDNIMLSDIPGFNWSLLYIASKAGIKYFSSGPNYMPSLPHKGDRIGYTIEKFGDRPFYWVMPDGKNKILTWISAKGYSYFHTGNSGKIERSNGRAVLDYLDELYTQGFPYDMVFLRYTIGGDNGGPDPDLSDFVKNWNEKYASPKLIISTNSIFFNKFEKKYGKMLPYLQGDFTPYWEDGALSSTFELSRNREAIERTICLEKLDALYDLNNIKTKNLWKNILLFDEHTWGANISVSDPECDFTKKQWEIKKSFSDKAFQKSYDNLKAFQSYSKSSNIFYVVNIQSWKRGGIVKVVNENNKYNCVTDGNNFYVLQKFYDDTSIFYLPEIEKFSSKKFSFCNKKIDVSKTANISDNTIETPFYKLVISQKTGAVIKLYSKILQRELVDFSKNIGINQFFYKRGFSNDSVYTSNLVDYKVIENGAVFVKLQIKSLLEGCNFLLSNIYLYKDIPDIDIENIIDKKKVLAKESAHVGFSFNISDPIINIDNGWKLYRPECDQLIGSCKDYLSLSRFVDISNYDFGITIFSYDIPLVEIGDITAEVWHNYDNRPWIKHLKNSSLIYFYILNNYWHTNYKAYQEGNIYVRFSLSPHKLFDEVDIRKKAINNFQNLLVVYKSFNLGNDIIDIDNDRVFIPYYFRDDDGTIVFVVNNSTFLNQKYRILSKFKGRRKIYFVDYFGNIEKEVKIGEKLVIEPYGIRFIKLKK